MRSGNYSKFSVQNIMFSPLLSKEVKTEICKTTNLPVVSYESETLSLAFMRKHSLRACKFLVARTIFGFLRARK
jgi:pseudouridine-5'-phosphate glycosidase